MKYLATFTVIASLFGGFGTSAADAHFLRQHKGESTHHFATRLVRHATTGIRWIKRHPTNYKSYSRYRQALRNHRWLLKYGQRLERKSRPVEKAKPTYLPAHYREWLCIHSHEGAWDANTGNGYYGGLQFGWSEWMKFGASYGYPVPASNASPMQQMWAAERYWKIAGFYPWPNTARYCGLI